MPLLQTIKTGNISIAVWEMTESGDELCRLIALTKSDQCVMEKLTVERREKEFLTVRILLSGLMDCYPEIGHDSHRKPFLVNSKLNLSISHSRVLAAVILSDNPVGIDTEETTRSVAKIAPRFLTEDELLWTSESDDPGKAQLFCWSCKEAVFKIMGIPGLDFRVNMQVSPTELEPEGITYVKFRSTDSCVYIPVNYFFWKNNVVTWCTGK